MILNRNRATIRVLIFLLAFPSFSQARALKSLGTRVQIMQTSPGYQPKGNYNWTAYNSSFSLIYVRVPIMNGGTNDRFPETDLWVNGFTGPGQLIYSNGTTTKILFDCSIAKKLNDAAPAKRCLPMDPVVSFDGKKVLFSVVYGDIGSNGQFTQTIGARLYEADLSAAESDTESALQSKVVALPYRQLGDFDTGPVYVPNASTAANINEYSIMFTSNRSRELPSSLLLRERPVNTFNSVLLQLYIADKFGNKVERIGPHDRDGILHPYVMSDGRVAFTTWSLSHVQIYKKNNGSDRNTGDPRNEAWVASVDSLGGNFAADYGRHSRYFSGSVHAPTINNATYISACETQATVGIHFLAESSDKRWECGVDYYRTNNKGAGTIDCWERMPPGIEGPYSNVSYDHALVPRFMFRPFFFGKDGFSCLPRSDDQSNPHGILRDPSGMPNNQFLVSWLKGNGCSRPDLNPGQPCNAGIYLTTKIPTGTADMKTIVDSNNYHEFMPKPLLPYQVIYGQAAPRFLGHEKSSTGLCYLGSGSMQGDVQPLSPYGFNDRENAPHDCGTQGCKARNKNLTDVKAIRFWEVLAHDQNFLGTAGQPHYLKATTGNRLRLLGDAPVESDGSFVARLPCDTTYVMGGVNGDGEVLLRDQVTQSLRKGEVRTCKGCHLHGSEPNRGREFSQSLAGTKFRSNPSLVTNLETSYLEMWLGQAQNIPNSKIVYDYSLPEVQSVLNKISFFSGISGTSTFFADVSAGYELNNFLPDKRWHTLTVQPGTTGPWHAPMLSPYLHMAFAVESPIYWMINKARLDGRSDGTNVNFGANYLPLVQGVSFTNEERRIFKNWIESGAYLHQGNLPKDYKPGL